MEKESTIQASQQNNSPTQLSSNLSQKKNHAIVVVGIVIFPLLIGGLSYFFFIARYTLDNLAIQPVSFK